MAYRARHSLEDLAPSDESIIATGRRITERVGEDMRDRVARNTPVSTQPEGFDVKSGSLESMETWLRERGGRRPGTLRESWKVGEVVVAGTQIRMDVYTEDPVAPFVEWPTAPHLILPRKPGGVLRFRDRHGNVVFAKVVNHPGTAGAHMLATAEIEVAATWMEIGEEEVARWAAEA